MAGKKSRIRKKKRLERERVVSANPEKDELSQWNFLPYDLFTGIVLHLYGDPVVDQLAVLNRCWAKNVNAVRLYNCIVAGDDLIPRSPHLYNQYSGYKIVPSKVKPGCILMLKPTSQYGVDFRRAVLTQTEHTYAGLRPIVRIAFRMLDKEGGWVHHHYCFTAYDRTGEMKQMTEKDADHYLMLAIEHASPLFLLDGRITAPMNILEWLNIMRHPENEAAVRDDIALLGRMHNMYIRAIVTKTYAKKHTKWKTAEKICAQLGDACEPA